MFIENPFNFSSSFFEYLWSIFAELAVLPLALLFYPFGIINFNPTSLPKDCKRVTLLVHGFLHNSGAWFYIRQKLKNHPEIGAIFTINLGHPFQSIDDYSRYLSEQIELIRQMTSEGVLEINLVGHSMGGLVCSNYAASLSADDRVKICKIVTVASPLQGCTLAHVVRFFPCADQMTPEHPFIRQLHQRVKRISKKRLFHIGCRGDLVVNNHTTHFLGGRNDREIGHLGHLGCLLSPVIACFIIEGISEKD
jgi:triacylglycerol lipase